MARFYESVCTDVSSGWPSLSVIPLHISNRDYTEREREREREQYPWSFLDFPAILALRYTAKFLLLKLTITASLRWNVAAKRRRSFKRRWKPTVEPVTTIFRPSRAIKSQFMTDNAEWFTSSSFPRYEFSLLCFVPEKMKTVELYTLRFCLVDKKSFQFWVCCIILGISFIQWVILIQFGWLIGIIKKMQDQYILHTAESQNISLPFACRHGIVL